MHPQVGEARPGGRRRTTSPDCIIVGAGILGCSIALALARKGREPLVVDREEECGMGSTRLSTAVIRQRYRHAPAIALALEGMRTWQSWPEFLRVEDPLGLARFRETGVLWLVERTSGENRAIARRMEIVGAPCELLEVARVAGRFPHLRLGDRDECLEGMFEPAAGFIDEPALAAHNVRIAAEAAGARFLLGTKVSEVTTRPGGSGAAGRQVTGIVTGTGGAILAPTVVNAAGPHSAVVNLMARSPLPLTTAPARQQFLEGPAPSLAHGGAPMPVVADLPGGYYCKPDPFKFRVGSLDPCEERDFQLDPDRPDPIVNAAFRKQKLAALAARMPSVRLRSPRPHVGLYDVTVADWHPILDRSDVDGYFVAIGTSGAWFKAGPAIGHAMGELIDAVDRGHDHDRDPLLIRLPRTGNLLDLGFFSRLRRPIGAGGLVRG